MKKTIVVLMLCILTISIAFGAGALAEENALTTQLLEMAFPDDEKNGFDFTVKWNEEEKKYYVFLVSDKFAQIALEAKEGNYLDQYNNLKAAFKSMTQVASGLSIGDEKPVIVFICTTSITDEYATVYLSFESNPDGEEATTIIDIVADAE